jgi:hypothetical protein
VPRESDRLFEMATLIGQRLNAVVKDVVPAEAQVHLLNAQRELLTALFLIYEQQAGVRRDAEPTTKRSRTSRARRPRVQRIEIE